MNNYVFVNAYYRIRFGKVEYVRAHWRGLPDSGGSTPFVALLHPRVA
jgi:hypothetical protein